VVRGLGIDDPVWHPTAFTANRDRLLEGAVAARSLAAVLHQPRVRRLLSREHFMVDGTLVEAWASLKSFRPKDDRDEPPGGGRNASRDFHSELHRNDTHPSTTDPDARVFRKGHGKEAKLCFMGHVLMENRQGLVVEAALPRAAGFAERLAAVALVAGRAGPRPITVGADKGYDTSDFVMELRELGPVPHVAQHTTGRPSAIDRRTTRHPGCRRSQRARHGIEEVFAWVKTIAGQSKTKHRGLERVRWSFTWPPPPTT